jgi:hypothetical protein
MTAIRSAGLALVVASMLCWASASRAYIALPKESLAQKVAVADCVVLGKITAIQDKPVQGKGGMRGVDFTIVEVEIKESLYGAKDKKQIRMGFPNIDKQGTKQGAKPGRSVGQIGYFCGLRDGKNDFYIVPVGCSSAEKDPGFEKDLTAVRRLCRLLEHAEEGLKSTDVEERLLTAYLLILRNCYAPWRRGMVGEAKPIHAEQSKRILLALAEGDWKKNRREVRGAVAALQLSVKFGAPPLKDFPPEAGEEQWVAAAKQWLKQNAETYRIHQLWIARPGPASREKKEPTEATKLRVQELIQQLDADKFTKREQASHELKALGMAIVPQLEAALERNNSLEVRRRLQQLLARYRQIPQAIWFELFR